MPIVAVCPYCGQGKVRAPDNALGLSATCPRCHNCFTLVASSAADVKESARAPAAGRRPTLPAAAVPKPEPSAVVETAVVTRMPTPPPPPVRVADPVSTWTPADTDLPMPGPNVALPVALVALTLAGVGLVVSQAPYGRLGAAALTALGLLLGLGSLLLSERKRLVAAFAAILNGAVLFVVVVLPGLLGLSSWLPAAVPDDSHTVQALAHDGTAGAAPEWVDVSAAAWQQGDVRVGVRALSVGPVELAGPNNQKKWTKDKALQIWLHVTNSGVARKIDFQGWSATATDASAPRLTDAAGKALAAKTFEHGWEPTGRAQPAGLFPGKSADCLLVYDAPAPTAGDLHLELPATAFAGEAPVRLLIPRSYIIQRTSP